MIKTRALTADGLVQFSSWLLTAEAPAQPPANLKSDGLSEPFGDLEIDPVRKFASRLEFGFYLVKQFEGADFGELMAPNGDGLWAWLAVQYFDQLARKEIRRAEHYVVTRKGSAGSLAYRHAVRTPFELVYIHGKNAAICLRGPMHTHGELTEQLASRQTIAHNKGFFQAASELYVRDGKLRRGASSKPARPKDRKPGDRTGLGSVRRLALALQRLDLTYDTAVMPSLAMKAVLPKEFEKWSKE